jgi:hypothetical protein
MSIFLCRPRIRKRTWLYHHGAPGYAADVWFELDLRRDGPARRRHSADTGAGDPSRALEAPGSLIAVTPQYHNGKAERISIENVPSFADRLDAPLKVAGLGSLKVDTAYGGDNFVIVDAAALGFVIAPDEARDLTEMGIRIITAANEQLWLLPSQVRQLGPHLLLSVHRTAHARRKRTSRFERIRHPPWEDRPLADRDRLQGQHGGSERARTDGGGRRLSCPVHHRLRVRLPNRAPGHDRRPAGHCANHFGPGMDYRRQSVYAGPRRSVAVWLPALGYMAAH